MLKGEGIWIWQLPQSAGGSVKRLVTDAVRMKFDHVLIKCCDGKSKYMINDHGDNRAVAALRAAGIQVAGWGYHYGGDPDAEAKIAVAMCRELSHDVYVLNAEREFETAAGGEKILRFIQTFRAQGGVNISLGLSTFSLPSLHGGFPYAKALVGAGACEFVLPQVYTVPSRRKPSLRTALTYLEEARRELAQFGKPVIPTLRAYRGDGLEDEEYIADDAIAFLEKAPTLGLPAWNWWNWPSGEGIPRLWAALAQYPNVAPGCSTPSLPLGSIRLEMSKPAAVATAATLEMLATALRRANGGS